MTRSEVYRVGCRPTTPSSASNAFSGPRPRLTPVRKRSRYTRYDSAYATLLGFMIKLGQERRDTPCDSRFHGGEPPPVLKSAAARALTPPSLVGATAGRPALMQMRAGHPRS